MVSEKDKAPAKNLAKILEFLPESKKEFLLGYAEGVMAMAERKTADSPRPPDPPASTTRPA